MLALCKGIVIFLILAKILESFQAGNKYGKFVKFIISLIVLLKILTPVISFLESDFDFTDKVNEMESKFILEKQVPKETIIEQVETIEMPEIVVEVEEVNWKK